MINYPTSLDNFSNPTTSDPLKGGTVPHATQHSDANDAIEALQAKVGVNNSAVTSSHDYKLSEVTGSDKAVGKTATQTLSNKILTAPQINMGSDATGDMYFRNSSGVTSRLPIGATGTILEAQSSGIPAWVPNPSTADASTTVKGVSQEATQAQVLARTATGSTSARLFVNPSTLTTVQTYDHVADAGGTDAYAITVTPAPTAYVTGQVFRFRANTANTGTATLNVNSLGAITIRKPSPSGYVDLETGDILAQQLVEVMYNGTHMIATSTLSTQVITASNVVFNQQLVLNNNGITTIATAFNMATAETDGSVFYTVIAGSPNACFLERWQKDSTGAYYRSHTATHDNPGGVNYTSTTARFGLAVVGSHLYLCYSHSSTTTLVFRFNKADLTGETAITISGTAPTGSVAYKQMYTNGTDLIICSSTTSWFRYTISGTTITNAASVTTISGASIEGCVADASNVFFTGTLSGNTEGTIYKYSFTGTSISSIDRTVGGAMFASGNTFGLSFGGSSVFYFLRGGRVESNTTQTNRVMYLIPFAKF